ncbi:MAG: histidine phosphatase family protein [Lachnospiraceae bacterium]|nr:histidine phosphatase family protein [Lachnospiraceae bacterium]
MWDWTSNQRKIVLIRHGATASNREHRYLGKTDEELDMVGRMELLAQKENGRYPNVDYLFVSPMKRCKETADILYPETPYSEISEWTEMDFGEFEGKNYQELSGDQRYQEWIDSGGILPFPGGESREAFVERCAHGFEMMWNVLEPLQQGQLTVGCIVHGGTIMALLSRFHGGEYFDYQVPNGGIYWWIPSGSAVGGSILAAASDPSDR